MNIRNDFIEKHYRASFDKLVKIISRRMGGNIPLSEEVVQEAYARALKYFKLYDSKRDFNSWFNTILNNACSNAKSEEMHRGVIKDNEELENIADESDKENNVHWRELKRNISKDVERVENETHRQVLDLHFNKGLTPAEVVEVVEGVSREAAKKIIQRFRPVLLNKYALG